jgi:hypothetical protein
MTDNASNTPAEGQESAERKRFRSEIEFPYTDLDNAVELADTIHSKAGASCEIDELAAWMGQSANGGTFRSRLGAARMFGLVETGQGSVSLTQLGRDALDNSGNERLSRINAFLNVELFGAMYDRYKGNTLPPPPAIERQMEQLGVSPKQKERARQTFMKSAHYAGFIDSATGRFVKPGISQKEENTGQSSSDNSNSRGGSGGGSGTGGNDNNAGLNLDPLLIALLKKIPAAEKGAWPAAQRIRWFRTFAMNVSQIYDDDAPVEMEIKAAKIDE